MQNQIELYTKDKKQTWKKITNGIKKNVEKSWSKAIKLFSNPQSPAPTGLFNFQSF